MLFWALCITLGLFSSTNLKKLDVSIQGTQASVQLGPSDAADLYQYTLEEDLTSVNAKYHKHPE
jgi:hypothetical protein